MKPKIFLLTAVLGVFLIFGVNFVVGASYDQKTWGRSNAKLIMEMYTDLQNSFSVNWYDETLPQLREEYIDNGDLKIVFKHFPLESVHHDALDRAKALECAAEQGYFEEFITEFYSDIDMDTSMDDYKAIVDGLDADEFEVCFNKAITQVNINSDINDGNNKGVTGVPHFFIGDQEIDGAQPFYRFQEIIDSLLVSGPCTQIGNINYQSQQYCDVDKTLKVQKSSGMDCVNGFECLNEKCVEGLCQSGFEGLVSGDDSTKSLLNQIWEQIRGYECVPMEDDCASDKKLVATCGVDFTWEEKGSYVNGRCGYSAGGGGTGGGGGGSGGRTCVRDWSCTSWSNSGSQCGTRTCTDKGHCGGWPVSKPIEVKECPGNEPYCGDGNIDLGEECDDGSSNSNTRVDACRKSCDLPSCGDSVCDSDESSATCRVDCKPAERADYLWAFILLIVLLLSAISYVGFSIYRRTRGVENASIGRTMGPPRPSGFPPRGRPLQRRPPRNLPKKK